MGKDRGIPTDIQLSKSTIEENQPINTVIGTLSTSDPYPGDTFTYTLVSGLGDTDNGSFNINGDQLRNSAVFDYETKNSYSIRIRTTDSGGLYFEKVFTITVTHIFLNLINGDFEQGNVSWGEYSAHGYPVILQIFPEPIKPYYGTWAAWLGGTLDEISYIQQEVTIPVDQPYLSYMHWITSSDVCGNDIGMVLINGVVVASYDLCVSNITGGWINKVVDLHEYAGTTVILQIRAECDGYNNSNLFIDNVTFQANSMSTTSAERFVAENGGNDLKQDILEK